MIDDKHIRTAKNFSWETGKQVLGIVVVGGGLIYAIAAPWAERFINEAVAGTIGEVASTIGELERKTDVYISEQTKRTNEIKNRQAAILEYQRIKEKSDKEVRDNLNEILRLIRER